MFGIQTNVMAHQTLPQGTPVCLAPKFGKWALSDTKDVSLHRLIHGDKEHTQTSWMMLSEAESILFFFMGDVKGST